MGKSSAMLIPTCLSPKWVSAGRSLSETQFGLHSSSGPDPPPVGSRTKSDGAVLEDFGSRLVLACPQVILHAVRVIGEVGDCGYESGNARTLHVVERVSVEDTVHDILAVWGVKPVVVPVEVSGQGGVRVSSIPRVSVVFGWLVGGTHLSVLSAEQASMTRPPSGTSLTTSASRLGQH